MPNGGSEWTAIDELRRIANSNRERISTLEAENRAMSADVTEIKRQLLASEARIIKHVDDGQAGTNARFDRMRNTALALLAIAVPVISGLIGALLNSGGP